MGKPKIGFYWCASCGGCEEAIVDLHEDLLPITEQIDIVFWPCAMDFKYSDVRKMADNEMTACFINGAVRNSEQVEIVELLRRKAQIIIAFGACAQVGGIPGLANFHTKEELYTTSYGNACPSIDNPDNTVPLTVSKVPEGNLTLPKLHNTVKSLDQVIDVDYYLPGCSPAPYLTKRAVEVLLSGNLPAKGIVLAPNKTLCDQCTRNETKPDKLSINELKRISLTQADPEKCFLAQGIICMGPVTRAGCTSADEGRCVRVNMPCRGCYGPTDEIIDTGAKMTATLASIIGLEKEETMKPDELDKLLAGLPDPAGLFYRFTLPVSFLKRSRQTG